MTQLQKEAYKQYIEGGATAVYDFARRENITDWRECKGCDAETPFVQENCLVCGQSS